MIGLTGFLYWYNGPNLQATELTLNEEGHMVFVDEELYAGCSISVDGMITVLLKAVEYAK